MDEFNVLIGTVPPEDVASFFGDNAGTVPDSDVFIAAPADAPFFALMADLGFFRSRSDARRNGWDRVIPEGWTDLRVGKLKRRVCVLKNTTGW